MRYLGAALLVGAAFVAACAPLPVRELRLPPERIVQNGYSVVPLDEPGWILLGRNLETFVLGKRASDPDENFIVRGFVRVAPALSSEEEFVGFAKSALVMDGASRHKVLSQQANPVTVRGRPCVRTDTVTEDRGAVKRSSRSDPMILEVFALVCKHPNQTNAVLVAYSHRYYKENKDSDSATKAQRIFDSIEFSDL